MLVSLEPCGEALRCRSSLLAEARTMSKFYGSAKLHSVQVLLHDLQRDSKSVCVCVCVFVLASLARCT